MDRLPSLRRKFLFNNLDAGFPQKLFRRIAANQDENKLIRQFAKLAGTIEEDSLGPDSNQICFTQYGQARFTLHGFKLLAIAVAKPVKRSGAVSHGDAIFPGAAQLSVSTESRYSLQPLS
jgi:hypothetical protein